MQSYDYARRTGVEEISWDGFAALSAELAERLAAWGAEVIVGIARAGLFPATAVACALRRELYPVRITRRIDDRVSFAHPVWRVDMPSEVRGRAVAVVDEIVDSGETLALAAERAAALGAVRVMTSALVAHSWAKPPPDVASLVSDALIIFPWDRKVYAGGAWGPHPELVEALRTQGLPDDLLR